MEGVLGDELCFDHGRRYPNLENKASSFKNYYCKVRTIEIQLVKIISRSKLVMGRSLASCVHIARRCSNLGKEVSRSKIIDAWLSTIKVQLIETIFTPKFEMGAELRKPPPCIPRWGTAQLQMISVLLSTFEAQLISGGLAWGLASHQPYLHIWRLEVAYQLSTIGAKLNLPNLTLKFGMGEVRAF